jgi:hypothetical protein
MRVRRFLIARDQAQPPGSSRRQLAIAQRPIGERLRHWSRALTDHSAVVPLRTERPLVMISQ